MWIMWEGEGHGNRSGSLLAWTAFACYDNQRWTYCNETLYNCFQLQDFPHLWGKCPHQLELGQGQEDCTKGGLWLLACHEWCIEWANATHSKWELQSHFSHSCNWGFLMTEWFKKKKKMSWSIRRLEFWNHITAQLYVTGQVGLQGRRAFSEGRLPQGLWQGRFGKASQLVFLSSSLVILAFQPRDSA